MKTTKTIKIVDLFCGMGGLTIGALQASAEMNINCEISFACDMDESTSDFYTKNFGSNLKSYYQGDISDIICNDFSMNMTEFEEEIPEKLADIDFLFAGPPCQGHSNLNNHSRREDPRNALYLKTIKFIKLCLPTYFIVENVPSVIHSKESVVTRSIELLLSYGYQVQEMVVDFKLLGVPQGRKRHVIFGSLNNDLIDTIANIYTDKLVVLADVLSDLLGITNKEMFNSASKMSKDNIERANYLYSTNSYDLPNELRPACHRGTHSYKSMYGRLRWDKVAQTITGGFGSMGQGRFLHPIEKRVITPHEAARIQGLPDWLDYSGVRKRSQLQKMIGNAVPPPLSKNFVLSTQGLRP